MRTADVWMLFGKIVQFYPTFASKSEADEESKVEEWHDILREVPYDRAIANLRRYASNPDNRWPPHPGALAADFKTDADRYHEHMRAAGIQTLQEYEQMVRNAVPPTPEQSRRVREMLAKRR